MVVVTNATEYDTLYQQWAQHQKIVLVPTMGALHEGHAALIRMARKLADIVVVSIFVNPLQFGPQEDLARYPRPIEQDLALCRELGVDVVFHPTVETMYPDGMEHTTQVVPPAHLTDMLCGQYRPGHFTGMATVVLKLFNLTRPHQAIFGEKDAQQLMIIRKMVQDFHLPIDIVAHPTVREADGLAMSSRNRYLDTPQKRQAALALSQILSTLRERVQNTKHPLDAAVVLPEVQGQVLAQPGHELCRVQYLSAVDKHSFIPVSTLTSNAKVLIAGTIEEVRLIDNMDMGSSP